MPTFECLRQKIVPEIVPAHRPPPARPARPARLWPAPQSERRFAMGYYAMVSRGMAVLLVVLILLLRMRQRRVLFRQRLL